VGGQRHAPAAMPPGKRRHPLYRRLGGLQGRSGLVRKISPPPSHRDWIPGLLARSESLYRLKPFSVPVLRLKHWGCVEFTESSHIEYTPHCRTLPPTSHSAGPSHSEGYRVLSQSLQTNATTNSNSTRAATLPIPPN